MASHCLCLRVLPAAHLCRRGARRAQRPRTHTHTMSDNGHDDDAAPAPAPLTNADFRALLASGGLARPAAPDASGGKPAQQKGRPGRAKPKSGDGGEEDGPKYR